MFKTLKKYFLSAKTKEDKKKEEPKYCSLSLSTNLQENIAVLRNIFSQSSDLIVREFYFGGNENLDGVVIYLDNTVDTKSLQQEILETLMFKFDLDDFSPKNIPEKAITVIRKNSVSIGGIKEEKQLEQIIEGVLRGKVIVLINFIDSALLLDTPGWAKRGIEEPANEKIVRGPREGFIEDMGTNIALIRRKIPDIRLVVETHIITKRDKKRVSLIYLRDLANPTIVDHVRQRIRQINVETIGAVGEVEQLIEEHPWSLFPQMLTTERVDKTVANIMEGRVAIMLDGTPFSLLIPAVFHQFLQTTDDYSERFIAGSFFRLVRYGALFATAVLPGLYIALISYHTEMIPYNLVISISGARQSVPFTPFLEAVFMEVTLEVLREGGLRLPTPIGQTVGIVGGIALGQAVVQAKIVSPIMIIVVAFTAISSFVVPNYSMGLSVRILRFLLMGCAAFLGLFGLILGLLVTLVHLVGLDSFGIPYFAPLAPLNPSYLKDTLVRAPIKFVKKKPVTLFSFRPKSSKKKGKEKNGK